MNDCEVLFRRYNKMHLTVSTVLTTFRTFEVVCDIKTVNAVVGTREVAKRQILILSQYYDPLLFVNE